MKEINSISSLSQITAPVLMQELAPVQESLLGRAIRSIGNAFHCIGQMFTRVQTAESSFEKRGLLTPTVPGVMAVPSAPPGDSLLPLFFEESEDPSPYVPSDSRVPLETAQDPSALTLRGRNIEPITLANPLPSGPIFESYWETWNMTYPTDYGSQLSTSPIGTGQGNVNIASVAFGNYTFSTDSEGNITIGYVNDQMKADGTPYTAEDLKADIAQVHAKGGLVKLSLGGATFSMSSVVKTEADALVLAQNIAAICQQAGFDGVDFDIEDTTTPANLQLAVFQNCRQLLGPDALISYTIPAMGELSDPWKTVITEGSQYLSFINVMCYDYYWSGYDPSQDFTALMNMGVPKNKIVWGIMPGQADDPNENLTVAQAEAAAQYVRDNGLGGIMMWDINRDTNHRSGVPAGNNIYQTDQPDGTFITAVSGALNPSFLLRICLAVQKFFIGIQNHFKDLMGISRPLLPPAVSSYNATLPVPREFMQNQGDSCYVDMGMLYGNYITSNCIDWWPLPVCIDQAKTDAFLDSLFAQMNTDGISKVELSFAQICDINNLLNKQAGSASDTITQIFADGYQVGTTGQDFLMYFNQKAHAAGIQVDLSFGGEVSSPTDMTLNGDPATQAQNLSTFMQNYGFDSVDFDIENNFIMQQNNPADVVTFFTTLHSLLAGQGKQSILTVEGGIQQGPAGILAPLFQNFDQQFDGINLMLYSTQQYYIDANNPTWGISEWMQYIPDPSKIHIGFYDSIPYEDPAASAGETYNIPAGATRGQAAAYIYTQLLSDLGYTLEQFGEPFWWTDDPTKIASDQVLEDFHNYFEMGKANARSRLLDSRASRIPLTSGIVKT